MKRVAWALVAPAIIVACSTKESIDLGDIDGGTTIVESDASTPPAVVADKDAGAPARVCGDGRRDANEECDDGNRTADDGCSPRCKFESAGPNDICTGLAVALTGTGDEIRKAQVGDTTASVYNQYAGQCGGGSGTDAVYVVTSDVTGLLKVKLSSNFDSLIYARYTCEDATTEAACSDAPGSAGGENLSVSITKGQPVYLFVDGYAGMNGPFTLDLEVERAACGNGNAEPPETCDDGNDVAGDGCAPDCALEPGGVIDDCPGQDILLRGTGTAVRHVSLANDTSTSAASTLSPAVCGGSGNNHVYGITPDVNGSLNVRLVASYEKASLHMRSECDNAFTQLDCRDSASAFSPISLNVPVVAGYPRFVAVDSGAAVSNGPYTLDVTLTPAACGNHVLDGGEQCDDGNAATGDGCAPDCTLEPVNDVNCPGASLAFKPVSDPVRGPSFAAGVTSSTASTSNKVKAKSSTNGCSAFATASNDAIYTITAPVTGRLNARVAAQFDSQIYIRTGGCADAATNVAEVACVGAVTGIGPESMDFGVTKDTTYYVVVDGETANAGLFELSLVVYPAACGNSFVDPGETCDDGNATGGDGCSASCILEPATNDTCANAGALVVAPDGTPTTIDSGTTNLAHNQEFSVCGGAGKDAIYTITPTIDGVLSAQVTAGFNVTIGARSSCPTSTTASSPLVCANNTAAGGSESILLPVTAGQTYWLIVDGVAAADVGPFSMTVKLGPAQCGDGLISGSEQCDDGNKSAGDGCSATCTLEPLAGIDTCPGYTMTLAGTGNDPRVGTLTVDTRNLAANYSGNCGGNSKDGVVVVVPPVGGKLVARLTGLTYHAALHVRTNCTDAATEVGCKVDSSAPTGTREVVINGATGGAPYYLFVDGYNDTSGVGLLNVMVTP